MKSIVLLLLVLLLSACFTGGLHVTGVHETTLMSGKIEYYVEVLGPDLEVTRSVYAIVKDYIETNNGRIICDFEKLYEAALYDTVACRVR